MYNETVVKINLSESTATMGKGSTMKLKVDVFQLVLVFFSLTFKLNLNDIEAIL